MTDTNLQNENTIRRFLLGKMDSDERVSFEEEFIENEEIFEELRVVEDELIERYVRNLLSAAEKESFERNFLTTEKRRQKVAFTHTMIDELARQKTVSETTNFEDEKSSVWALIRGLFKNAAPATGTVFAVLLFAFGGWILLRNALDSQIANTNTNKAPIDIAHTNTTVTTNSTVNSSLSNATSTNTSNTTTANTNSIDRNENVKLTLNNQNAQTPKPALNPFVALFSGTVRSEGQTNRLDLPKGARGATLQLNLESNDYKTYRILITDPDGNHLFRSGYLKSLKSRVNIFVPAAKLKQGDYIIHLSGLNAAQQEESVADYSLQIIHK